jgi:hypothetical protein
MGGPLAWRLGVGLTTPHRKKKTYYGKRHEHQTWTEEEVSLRIYNTKRVIRLFCILISNMKLHHLT